MSILEIIILSVMGLALTIYIAICIPKLIKKIKARKNKKPEDDNQEKIEL